jgi:hypothetical protein
MDQRVIHVSGRHLELEDDFSIRINDDELDELILVLADFIDYEPVRGITETA